MTQLLHRSTLNMPRTAVAAQGVTITDSAGRDYIDASGGAAVSCLGHGHPDVIAALHRQADTLAYAHTGFFTTDVAEALGARLVADAPDGISHAYLVSGGSEAVEAALKLARQYFTERGEGQRRHIIARRQSYHGNTLGALAVGGNAWRRAQFQPLLMEAHHIAPCYAYREQRQDESEADYALRAAGELEAKIEELGAETVIGFVAEPVVGATAGAVTAAAGYFRKIREICDRNGILLILDEVMCGMGRTGTLHACEHEGIAPDLLTIAKGLGGGYQPVGAVLLNRKIYDAIAKGSGFFQHGHTYMGHPMAAAAALAVQRVIARDNLLANVREMGDYLRARLTDSFGGHRHVGDIRGRGLFQAIELVADRDSKAPFDPGHKLHARIKSAAMEAGLMVYPMGGTIDGVTGDHVLLAPPFIVGRDDIDQIVDRLAGAVDRALAELPSAG